MAVFKFNWQLLQKNDLCFNYLNKNDKSVLLFVSFQSNLGVLYMLKYECSNDSKIFWKKKNIFFNIYIYIYIYISQLSQIGF